MSLLPFQQALEDFEQRQSRGRNRQRLGDFMGNRSRGSRGRARRERGTDERRGDERRGEERRREERRGEERREEDEGRNFQQDDSSEFEEKYPRGRPRGRGRGRAGNPRGRPRGRGGFRGDFGPDRNREYEAEQHGGRESRKAKEYNWQGGDSTTPNDEEKRYGKVVDKESHIAIEDFPEIGKEEKPVEDLRKSPSNKGNTQRYIVPFFIESSCQVVFL